MQPGAFSRGEDTFIEHHLIRGPIVIGDGRTAQPADVEGSGAVEYSRTLRRRIDRPIVDLYVERIRRRIMPGTKRWSAGSNQ